MAAMRSRVDLTMKRKRFAITERKATGMQEIHTDHFSLNCVMNGRRQLEEDLYNPTLSLICRNLSN